MVQQRFEAATGRLIRAVRRLFGRSGEPEVVPDDVAVDRVDSGLIADLIEPHPPNGLISDSDQPGGDRFRSREVAASLADLIAVQDPPFTISLSGAWGSGKTTLTRELPSLLKDRVPVVEIDLWTEDLAQLRRTLAVKVAVALSGERDKEKVERRTVESLDQALLGTKTRSEAPSMTLLAIRAHKVGAAITFTLMLIAAGLVTWGISQPIASGQSSPAPGPAFAIALGTAAALWLLLQSGLIFGVGSRTLSVAPIAEAVGLRREFEKAVTSNGTGKVLIVLDNLDRLTSSDAVFVLADIRSFVDVKRSRCLFLVPIDRGALIRHLEKTLGDTKEAARDFLDKFFGLDVLLTLPAAEDLREWAIGLLETRFPRAQTKLVSQAVRIVMDAADGSPRAAKRIINGIYSRAYLLPKGEQGGDRGITLLAVTFIEGLIQRFPDVVPSLTQDPRGWLEAVESLRGTTDVAARNRALCFLVSRTYRDPIEAPTVPLVDDDSALRALERYILATRSTEIGADDIRVILSVRPTRQWAASLRQSEMRAALLDGTDVTGIMNEASAPDRSEALRLAVEEIEDRQQQGWSLGVLRGLTALASAALQEPELVARLRNVAGEFLSRSDPSILRQLTPQTISLIFNDGLAKVPFRREIISRALNELRPGLTPSAAPIVRILASVAPDMSAEEHVRARTALVALSDAELEPLFGDDRSALLLAGEVMSFYVERLANWDPSGVDQEPSRLAGDRLILAKRIGVDVDPSALQRVIEQASKITRGVPSEAIVLEPIVSLSLGAPPSEAIDRFAMALLGWATAGTLALQWAIDLPTTPGTITSPVRQALEGTDFSGFETIAGARRSRLENLGVPVTEIAAARWVNGMGPEYAPLALGTASDAEIETVMAAVAGAGDIEAYVRLVSTLAPLLVRAASPSGAERLMASIAERIGMAKYTEVKDLAPVVTVLQSLVSPDPVMRAVEQAIATSTTEDMRSLNLVGAARAYVEGPVAGADALPPAVATAAERLRAIDLAEAAWLLEQPLVAKASVRSGVVGEIEGGNAATVIPPLSRLRSPLRYSWIVGAALVKRASSAEPGGRLPWVEEASAWHAPPGVRDRQARDEYLAALDRALQDDSSLANVVERIRSKVTATP